MMYVKSLDQTWGEEIAHLVREGASEAKYGNIPRAKELYRQAEAKMGRLAELRRIVLDHPAD